VISTQTQAMPQLAADTFAPQIIWLAISFAALYFLMARVALPRIAHVLEERQDRIANDLEQAEKLRDEARAAQEAYEAALAEARSEAHATASQAREAAAAEAAVRAAESDSRLAARIAEAEARIAAAKAEAVAKLGATAGDIARAATARLIGVEVDAAAAAQAVEAEAEGGG
jgi:F-type H+-transporting ATPase subunit b